jgi:hypothetical protein
VKPRYLAALVAAGLLFVGSAGCGIPDQTDVRVDGGGQAPGGGSARGTGREAPRRTDSRGNVKQFALDFLAAAAGEASTADNRVRDFLSPQYREGLPETGKDESINVVRLIDDEPNVSPDAEGGSTVSIAVQQVGVLRPNGVLDKPDLIETSYTFHVGSPDSGDLGKRDESTGLYIYKPPPELLMSVDALNEFYEQQTIYFWSQEDNPRLVPDLRYLPTSVPAGLRPTEVLGWLTSGPAEWLKGSVRELPQGTRPIGNAPENNGRLVVNLAAPALTEVDVRRLTTQLAWSLREIYARGQLELMIQDKRVRVFDVDQQRLQNPVYEARPPEEPLVSSYCVLAGAVYRVAAQGEPPGPPLPIAAGRNQHLAAAAVARGPDGAILTALVTSSGHLLVGTGNPAATNFAKSSQPVGTQARPVWLRGLGPNGPVGLVVAHERLHRFGVDAQLESLQLRGAPGTVTAVSAAEDGRRIAVIAGGRLFVASLNATHEVAQVRPVPVSLHQPTAVAWIAENDLVVAGQNGRGNTTLVDVTVDGGVERQRLDDDLGTATVNYLAAYPNNSVRGDGPLVMYEADGAVWSGAAPVRVGVDQLQGADAATVGAARPAAPFFLY